MSFRRPLRWFLTVAGLILVPAFAQAGTKFGGTLVLQSPCSGCAIDGMKKATLSVRSNDRDGKNGVVFSVGITGATLAGAPATFTATPTLDISIGGGACQAVNGPPLQVAKGKGKVKFTAADIGLAGNPADPIVLCGRAGILDESSNLVAALGLRKGTGGPLSCGVGYVALATALVSDVSTVTWSVAPQSAVVSYDIERGSTPSNLALIGNVAATPGATYSFADSAAPIGLSYYRVVAHCAGGATVPSSTLQLSHGQTCEPDFFFSQAYNDGSNVVVHWVMSSETSGNDYLVSRSGNGSLFSQLAVIPADQTNDHTYTDTTPLSGTSYYRIVLRCADDTFSEPTDFEIMR